MKRVRFEDKYNVEYIIQEYKNGRTTTSIAKELGTYNTSIRRLLLKNNIVPRDSSEALKTVKDTVFTCMSEEAQYWIGYIIADGTIGNNDNLISLSTVEKDKDHLNKYSIFTGAKIHKVLNKRFNLYEYRVSFKNKALKKWFISQGITSNKSFSVKLEIPLTASIVRGIFDGDGHVSKTGNIIEIATASIDLVLQLHNYFLLNNIHTTFSKANTSSVYILRICKLQEREKFFNLIYKDASIYLKRKYDRIYAPLFGNL